MSLGEWLSAPVGGDVYGDQLYVGREVEFVQPLKQDGLFYTGGVVKYFDPRRWELVIEVAPAVYPHWDWASRADIEPVWVEFNPARVVRISSHRPERYIKLKSVQTNGDAFIEMMADAARARDRAHG